MRRETSFDWEFTWQVIALIGGVTLILWVCIVSYQQQAEKMAWLRLCAAQTHGWLEREAVGDTVFTDSKGNPTGSTVKFEYYVRTPEGRRINYRDDYKVE